MPRFCSSCGGQMEDSATFCAACGAAVAQPGAPVSAAAPAPAPAAPVARTAGGLEDNIAGMLAYITIVPAIIFLVMEPYNKNRFIRFHSFQNIFFHVAWIAVWIVLGIVGMIPVIGWLTWVLWPILGLGGFVVWVVLLLKAYQGQMFKLPFIGDFAEQQANAH